MPAKIFWSRASCRRQFRLSLSVLQFHWLGLVFSMKLMILIKMWFQIIILKFLYELHFVQLEVLFTIAVHTLYAINKQALTTQSCNAKMFRNSNIEISMKAPHHNFWLLCTIAVRYILSLTADTPQPKAVQLQYITHGHQQHNLVSQRRSTFF